MEVTITCCSWEGLGRAGCPLKSNVEAARMSSVPGWYKSNDGRRRNPATDRSWGKLNSERALIMSGEVASREQVGGQGFARLGQFDQQVKIGLRI